MGSWHYQLSSHAQKKMCFTIFQGTFEQQRNEAFQAPTFYALLKASLFKCKFQAMFIGCFFEISGPVQT